MKLNKNIPYKCGPIVCTIKHIDETNNSITLYEFSNHFIADENNIAIVDLDNFINSFYPINIKNFDIFNPHQHYNNDDVIFNQLVHGTF